jgi:dihydropteroate synthase
MHMLGTPKTMQRAPHYDDVVEEVTSYLLGVAARPSPSVSKRSTSIRASASASCRGQCRAAKGTARAGRARCAGDGWHEQEVVSRHALEGEECALPLGPEERFEGSLATAVWSMACGAAMVRVHDVGATSMAAALLGDS